VHVGVCRMTFHLQGNDSLKGKRQVSRSLIGRLRQRFNLAVAEVDAIDVHQRLVIGLTCVSNDVRHANEMLGAAIRFAEEHQAGAELVDVEREIIDGA
jgi:uncharacterized protein YlxP (DUF503 family)